MEEIFIYVLMAFVVWKEWCSISKDKTIIGLADRYADAKDKHVKSIEDIYIPKQTIQTVMPDAEITKIRDEMRRRNPLSTNEARITELEAESNMLKEKESLSEDEETRLNNINKEIENLS